MTNGKSAIHKESFVRWQGITIQQLGYSINLVLAFATASLGFAFNLLEHSDLTNCWGKIFFDLSLLLLVSSVALGIVCTVNRLCDFRMTKAIPHDREEWHREQYLKNEVSDAEIDSRLSERRSETKRLGRRTWRLFYGQIATFGLGILLMIVGLVFAFHAKLF